MMLFVHSNPEWALLLAKKPWTEQDIFTARRIGLLKPKVRDGCSDYGLCKVIDSWIPGFSDAMRPYCDAHDDDYEIGDYSGRTRRQADLAFFQASIGVVKKLGSNWSTRAALQIIRGVYYAGVRVGGPRLFRKSYSWGFGLNDESSATGGQPRSKDGGAP
jgi:hypothetical protein